MALARRAGLRELIDERLSVLTDTSANAGLKFSTLVARMVTGADSIHDLALLRHGVMDKLFDRPYAPSMLGSFLRSFTFGHVRQLDAVAYRVLVGLAGQSRLLGCAQDSGMVMVDIDDTIVEVHGYQIQGAGFGYSGVRGLNVLLATVTGENFAPVITAQRLRKGSSGSPRGADRLASDAPALVNRIHLADSTFYSHALVIAALKAGVQVSVAARMDPVVKRATATNDEQAWTTIKYPEAIFDEATGTWTSKAQVAEVEFTAFPSKKKTNRIPGLVVRHIPELNPR